MKKNIMKRILALTIVFMMLITTPLSVFGNLYNNHIYVYASTFAADIESEIFKQTLIPMLISAGLVFKSKEAAEEAVYELKDWLYDQGFDWQLPPDPEPEDPKLGDMIKALLASSTLVVWNSAEQVYQTVVSIPQWFWEFISTYANDNYNVGINQVEPYLLLQGGIPIVNLNFFRTNKNIVVEYNAKSLIENYNYITILFEDNDQLYFSTKYSIDEIEKNASFIQIVSSEGLNSNYVGIKTELKSSYLLVINVKNPKITGNAWLFGVNSLYDKPEDFDFIFSENENNVILGVEDIINNPDYDWNNQYTGNKDIVIPIQTDIYGNPKIDENGYYLPAVETEEWVDVQPEEIPLLDPSGVPQPDIPEIPEHDEEDSKDTGILITIATILATLLSKITGIKNDTSTMVEKMPDTSTDGTGGIGDGIGEVPTGFEWGDFRHLLDIFFIFIYFIVILILILLKFLQVVFTGLPAIPANTDLFTQYPTILEGVNYVKNLQVGGMSITVQQAFEYIFLIFFYIFIIKQIRKLYNAHVFEQPAENQRNNKDMKMDYYENSKHHESTNSLKGIEHYHNFKSNSYKDDDYENIKFTGWSDDK